MTMDEYISREAVLKHLNECKEDPLFDPDMARICFAISIFIEEMQAADVQPVNQWISVNDRLPEKEQKVLVFYKAIGEKNRIHNDVIATNWRKSNGDFIPVRDYEITHWMPLPEPPKDGDAE